MQMVVQGVSTSRVKEITTELCGREFSKSTVSRLSKDLEEQVQAWAKRQLDQEYPFLMLDAMQLKVRRQKARPSRWPRSTTAMLAAGIGENGQREILGLEMGFSETEEGWRRFIRQLKERGLSGVELATSVANVFACHEGLKQALQEAFPVPTAVGKRCQSHFRRNVLDQTPTGYQDEMHEVLDQILEVGDLRSPASQEEARTRLDDLGDLGSPGAAGRERFLGLGNPRRGLLRGDRRVGPAREVSQAATDNQHAGTLPPKAFGAEGGKR